MGHQPLNIIPKHWNTSKINTVYFILFSDDIKWVRTNIVGDNIIYFPTHTTEVDLAILASWDHVIISNGTYSWWAGGLCRGTTVRYKIIPTKHSWPYNVTSGHHWSQDKYNHYVAIYSCWKKKHNNLHICLHYSVWFYCVRMCVCLCVCVCVRICVHVMCVCLCPAKLLLARNNLTKNVCFLPAFWETSVIWVLNFNLCNSSI